MPHTGIWASPGALPPDIVGRGAAAISPVEHGLAFTRSGW
jgi:hypothetical protein